MFDQWFHFIATWIRFWPAVLVFVVLGIYGLKYGADWLVEGSANVGFRLGMSATVIGLTIVAFGTSAPELVVSVMTSVQEKPKLCLGNVVGSNIANTSLILGATALVFPLKIQRDSIRFDGPISFFAILLVCVLAYWSFSLSRWDGFLLLLIFSSWMFWLARKTLKKGNKEAPVATDEEPEVEFHKRSVTADIFLILVGLGALVVGAQLLVVGSVETAQALGVTEVVVGLTVVAIGTSLPELAVCLTAAFKHQGDITVGNVLGSNVFNALLILGVAVMIFPIQFAPDGFLWNGDDGTLYLDIPFCVLLCGLVIPLMSHRKTVGKAKGLFLLLLYVAYLVSLVWRTTGIDPPGVG